MPISKRLMLLAAGTLAVAALSLPALARDGITTTDFSAQGVVDPKAKRAPPRQAPARAAPVRRAAPVQRSAPRPVVRTAPVQRSAPRTVQGPPRVQRNVGPPRSAPRVVAPRAPITAGPRIIAAPRQGNRTFTPRFRAAIIRFGAATTASAVAMAGAPSLRSAHSALSRSVPQNFIRTPTSRRQSPTATASPKTAANWSGKTSKQWKATPYRSASPIAPGSKRVRYALRGAASAMPRFFNSGSTEGSRPRNAV